MLSRTADQLFWMSRYTERAENTARMLSVSYETSLLPQSAAMAQEGWQGLLSISELIPAYTARHGEVTPAGVLEFMVRDGNNPSSIASCLRAARENARAVRGALTTEIWETQNQTWLELSRQLEGGAFERDPAQFFEWVKYRSHLWRGVTQGTMLNDDALRFIRLGTFIERADNTARILHSKFLSLPGDVSIESPAIDYYPWSAMLHSVSAFEVYRKVYSDLITPQRVAELLILNPDMPRSLVHCLSAVQENLRAVANSRSRETERIAGEFEAELRFGRIGELVNRGLNGWLEEFLQRLFRLGSRIADDFQIPVNC